MTDQLRPLLTGRQALELWERDHAPRRPRRGEPPAPPAPLPPPPPGRVWLDPDQLACDGCGRAVPAGHGNAQSVETVTSWTASGRPRAAVQLGRCAGCASLHVHARQLLPDAAPEVDQIALARLLAVFRVLGQPLPDPARVSARDVARWFGAVEVAWAGRIRQGAEDGRLAAAEPWSHVPPDVRASLREQFARWQWVRARPGEPLKVAPPADGLRGCLMCGVGHLDVQPEHAHDPRTRAEALWSPVSVDPVALGGRGGQRVRGHLCPRCAAACTDLDGVRVIGPSSIERAIAEHWAEGDADAAAAARLLKAGGELTRPTAWAVLGHRAPNRTPWAHVGPPTLDEEA